MGEWLNGQDLKMEMAVAESLRRTVRRQRYKIGVLEEELRLMRAELAKHPVGSYAPGNYLCHCGNCGRQFQGDKRALKCFDCAWLSTYRTLNPRG